MSDDTTIIIRGTRHVVWQCKTCGVIATCPEAVYDQQRAEGGYHYCPNGHPWGWNKDGCERERLRRERDHLKQQIACKDDELAHERKQTVALKGQVIKLKKRAKSGVCPCCTRHFTNLERHIASKHPDFDPAATNVVPFEAKDTA